MTLRRIVISGCSGGGKSSLIEVLETAGFSTIKEAGRAIVREQMTTGGDALPWTNPASFSIQLAERAILQYEVGIETEETVFYDRSLIDPIAFLDQHGLAVPDDLEQAITIYRYDDPVFVVPPWKKIYVSDAERPKPFEQAEEEYTFLITRYRQAGYRLLEIPKISTSERAAFVINHL